MFPRDEFDSFVPGKDKYADNPAVLSPKGLEEKVPCNPKISYLISTWNRQHQLSRSLESLARQEFKEFEVLIMDDGSTQNLSPIFAKFEPYLHLRTFKAERLSWRSCPSRAFKLMIPLAEGEVIAISHPEIMLRETAMRFMYEGASGKKLENGVYYTIDKPKPADSNRYWVSLKPFFIPEEQYKMLNKLDWHSNMDNIINHPGALKWGGFAGQDNSWHGAKAEYPWWFAGACLASDPIWEELPIFDGHGIIDMWLCRYRAEHNMVDIASKEFMCFHQPHLMTAFAPEGEQDEKEK